MVWTVQLLPIVPGLVRGVVYRWLKKSSEKYQFSKRYLLGRSPASLGGVGIIPYHRGLKENLHRMGWVNSYYALIFLPRTPTPLAPTLLMESNVILKQHSFCLQDE